MARMRRSVEKFKTWYFRFERPISAAALIGGFVFDIFTLQRVDQFFENFWILIRLAIAMVGVIVINIIEREGIKEKVSGRTHFWILMAIQFGFGGILGTYLVFYFRSATLATSWPFMLFLTLVLMSNEARDRYTRLSFQINILFLSLYSFFIYYIPILMHRIGPDVFILSGISSLAVLALFLAALWYIARERFKKSRTMLIVSITAVTVLVNALYFTNLIPPIPISLKDAGVYHSIRRDAAGNFVVLTEPSDWWRDYVRSYSTFHEVMGEPIHAYSAVFSPTSFSTTIYHHWQRYDEIQKKWITQDKVELPIVGGRDGGYRTFSTKTNLMPGAWRVDIETDRGADVGRIRFNIIVTDKNSNLVSVVKN